MRCLFSNFSLRSAAILVVALLAWPSSKAQATIVRIETVFGNVNLRLYDTAAPGSVANFLAYVNAGDYNNTIFHRSDADFVVQGGNWQYNDTVQVEPQNYPTITNRGTITNEPGISNLRGTVALAKLRGNANSGSNQFFFNLDDNSGVGVPEDIVHPRLDSQNGGFTVFARVMGNGMDVIDAIADLPTFAFSGEWSAAPMRNYTEGEFQTFTAVDDDNLVLINRARVLPIPDGDFTHNNLVDHVDLAVWESEYGSTINTDADGNGDAVVDGRDFLLWQQSHGRTGPSAAPVATGVPEPSTLLLAAAALAGLPLRRRRFV